MATRRSGNRKSESAGQTRQNRKPKTQSQKKDGILIVVLVVMIVAVLAGGWIMIDSLLNPSQDNPALDNEQGGLSDLFGDDSQNDIPEDLANQTFYTGVFVDDISLGGLTLEEARTRLQENLNEKLAQLDVTVQFEDKTCGTFKVTPDMVTTDINDVLLQAMNVGRTGEEADMESYIQELPNNPVKLTTTVKVNPAAKENEVRTLAASLSTQPVDAQFVSFDATKPEGERFTFSEDVPGMTVDADKLWADVSAELSTRTDGMVEATATETPAHVTLESLQQDFTLIASFSTDLTKEKNRNTNVDLACKSISGLIMQPGDKFSFNGVVGERTKARGYKEAGVIVGGDRTEEGLGGGICQVSGTLFNAVVMSDLEITERFTHSYELSYLKRGRDATVDYGNKDFCFKNNKDKPIILVMTADLEKYTVTAQVYGPALENGMHIDIEVETTSTIRPPSETLYVAYYKQDPGTTSTAKARNGIRCTSYKVWYTGEGDNRTEVKREVLYKDYYPPVQPKVYFNPNDGDPSLSPSPSPTIEPTPTPTPTATPVVTPTQAPADPTPVVTQAPPADPTPEVTQAPADPTPEVTQAPADPTPVVTQAPPADEPDPDQGGSQDSGSGDSDSGDSGDEGSGESEGGSGEGE